MKAIQKPPGAMTALVLAQKGWADGQWAAQEQAGKRWVDGAWQTPEPAQPPEPAAERHAKPSGAPEPEPTASCAASRSPVAPAHNVWGNGKWQQEHTGKSRADGASPGSAPEPALEPQAGNGAAGATENTKTATDGVPAAPPAETAPPTHTSPAKPPTHTSVRPDSPQEAEKQEDEAQKASKPETEHGRETEQKQTQERQPAPVRQPARPARSQDDSFGAQPHLRRRRKPAVVSRWDPAAAAARPQMATEGAAKKQQRQEAARVKAGTKPGSAHHRQFRAPPRTRRLRDLSLPAVQIAGYNVEAILQKRQGKSGEEFLVKWEGFADEFNSWEPRHNLAGNVRPRPVSCTPFFPRRTFCACDG